MINRILPLLNKIVPLGLAAKGLEKINPKMKSFFSGAVAAGYTANEAMDFLRDQFSSGVEQQKSGSLRPDEQAGINRRKQEEAPARIAQGIGTLAAGALGGVGASALTGLGQSAMQDSQSTEKESQIQSQNPGGFQEFIKQNPELGAYLDSLMQKGMDPVQAASQAKKHRKFGPLVQSIEGQMGQSFEDLISQLFQGSQPNRENTNQNSQQSGQNTTQNAGDSELISALQQILKM